MGWGAGAVAFLVSGGIIAGAGGFFIAGMMLLYAIPVWGFTRNQRRLTKKGSELATNVGEVRQLIDHDAAAFRRVFAAFFPWRLLVDGAVVRQPSVVPEAARAAAAAVPAGSAAQLSDAEPIADASAPTTFWLLLTPAERRGLLAAGTERMFLTGAVLCNEGAPADRVFLIRSGWTKVCVRTPQGERILARRGPGDLVGERAAMRPGERGRSATVVAEEIVRALVMATEDFAAFVRSHPRVLDVLEGQLYGRLTEERARHGRTDRANHNERAVPAPTPPPPRAPVPPAPSAPPPAPPPPSWTGQNCSIVFLDVAGFGARNRRDADRLTIRGVMYRILHDALETSGIPWTDCHRDDRGDGVLVIVPPGTPTGIVVDALLTHLATGLFRHNDRATAATRFQLRVALDVGPVVSDPEGVSGQAIIHAARILDAPILKRLLAQTAAELGFIVSTYVYDNIITHHPGWIGPADYQRVSFQGKESKITAWMHLVSRPADLSLLVASRLE
jgi:cyclic nucleotide-binding protein